MLSRTLEPELMNDLAEVRLYDEMDHAEVNAKFVDDLIRGGDVGPDIIDLGTGTALIPVLLCQRLSGVRVMAMDAAVNMLEQARYSVELGGVLERIQLGLMDAKDSKRFEAKMFDLVMSNSLLHHLAEPELALSNAIRLVRDGGRIFFRDLLRPDTHAEAEHLVRTYTGREPAHAQQLFRQSLHAALTLDEIIQIAMRVGLGAERVQQTSDRHWTIDSIAAES